MHIAVYVALIVPVLLVPCLRLLAPRLHPRLASWLLASTMLIVGAGSAVSLAILQTAGLVKLPAARVLGLWSAQLLAQHDAVGVPVGIAASIALTVSLAAVAQALLSHRRALAEAHRELAGQPGYAGFTVVADDDPFAYALAGSGGRIVVSQGMLRALTAHERRALLAHERAHLVARHDLFQLAAVLAVRLNPLLMPLRGTLAYTIERWADESAAHHTGDRRAAARAVGKAALLVQAATRLPRAGLAATAGPVPRRVCALLRPPPDLGLRRQVQSIAGLACAVAIMLAFGSGLATAEAASDLKHALELAELTGH